MRHILWGLLLLTGLTSCDENQPTYTLARPEPGEKNVLVEEFSGARCPNCPQGTEALEELRSIYGSNLIIMTVHAGDFAFPYEDSKFDFATQHGDDLITLLGNPIGYPSAVVDRRKPEGANVFQQFSSKWSSSIVDALNEPIIVDLDQSIEFDPDTRELTVQISLLPLEDIDEPLNLCIALLEDNIVDPQADRAAPTGVVKDYLHKNVLRTYLTPVDGDEIATSFDAFKGMLRNYKFILPLEDGWWKARDCKVVSFISRGSTSGGDLRVLQCVESEIGQ